MAKEAINFILHCLFELGAIKVTKHLTVVQIVCCVRRQVREGIEGCGVARLITGKSSLLSNKSCGTNNRRESKIASNRRKVGLITTFESRIMGVAIIPSRAN
jgi:hypothetical protein